MFAKTRKLLQNFKEVLLHGKYPPETSLCLPRAFLRNAGMWPNSGHHHQKESFFYLIYNFSGLFAMIGLVLSITFDLYEASQDIEILGDDLCVLVGMYLILYKTISYRFLRSDIERIIAIFEKRHLKNFEMSDDVRKMQRDCYIRSSVIFFGYGCLGELLWLAICIQPVFSANQALPFRAKLPFPIDGRFMQASIYAFQCICTIYYLKIIIYVDNIGCMFIYQIYLQLQIVGLKLGRLGDGNTSQHDELKEIIKDHQSIIGIIELVNKTFQPVFQAQVAASMFMICLTAFEATLTFENPFVKIKFLVYMMSAFLQLLYWCFIGNKVGAESLNLAEIAYDCQWLQQTKQFKNDLMFLIQRAQTALLFKATPLHNFDYVSFLNILSGSYTYFTMLRTLHK